jgi:hypothetical protein
MLVPERQELDDRPGIGAHRGVSPKGIASWFLGKTREEIPPDNCGLREVSGTTAMLQMHGTAASCYAFWIFLRARRFRADWA